MFKMMFDQTTLGFAQKNLRQMPETTVSLLWRDETIAKCKIRGTSLLNDSPLGPYRQEPLDGLWFYALEIKPEYLHLYLEELMLHRLRHVFQAPVYFDSNIEEYSMYVKTGASVIGNEVSKLCWVLCKPLLSESLEEDLHNWAINLTEEIEFKYQHAHAMVKSVL